ncbi:MAG: HDOD domain-containing protein [Pedobacter sp.]
MEPIICCENIREAIEKLPMLSPNVNRLLQIISDEDYELDDVVNIVKYDAVLTAKVLKMVNSPVFGLLNPVTSLDRAISYLGKWIVVSIILSDNTGELFSQPLEGYEGQQNALWRHDLFAAFSCSEVARLAKQSFETELAFTAGLLHDIGKFVFAPFWKEAAPEALKRIAEGSITDYLAAERALAGMDHAQIGYEMAKHWEFPQSLQQAILYHHTPQNAPEEYRALAFAAHIGDMCAMMAGCDTGNDGMQYPLDNGYAEYFDVTSNSLAQILMEAEAQFKKAISSLSFEEEVD